MKRNLVAPLVILLAFSFVACASFTKNAYRTLGVASVSYDVAMKSAAELYEEGAITDEQKADIIKVGNAYYDAYESAIDALIAYSRTDGAEEKEKLETALVEFGGVAEEFTKVVRKYIGGAK